MKEAFNEHLVWNRSSRIVDRDFSSGLDEGLQLTRPPSLSCRHDPIAVTERGENHVTRCCIRFAGAIATLQQRSIRTPGSDEVCAGCAISIPESAVSG